MSNAVQGLWYGWTRLELESLDAVGVETEPRPRILVLVLRGSSSYHHVALVGKFLAVVLFLFVYSQLW